MGEDFAAWLATQGDYVRGTYDPACRCGFCRRTRERFLAETGRAGGGWHEGGSGI